MDISQHARTMQAVEDTWRAKGPSVIHTPDLLWDLLVEIADTIQGTVVWFLDGLDQAAVESSEHFMRVVNHHYSNLRRTSNLRFIISARPLFGRERSFKSLIKNLSHCVQHIEDQDVDLDIFLIIRSRVAGLELSELSGEHLVADLMNRTKGSHSFLWLRVVFYYLEQDPFYESATSSQISDLVSSIPMELDKAYDRMLESSCSPKIARIVLHILLGSREPLLLSTFRVFLNLAVGPRPVEVIAEGQSDETVKHILNSICGLLVTVMNSTVQVSHQTARDFLFDTSPSSLKKQPSPGSFKRSFHPIDSNMLLAKFART